MIKYNLFQILFVFVFIQLLITVEAKKCVVKSPEIVNEVNIDNTVPSNISDVINDSLPEESEVEIETSIVDNFDSDVETELADYEDSNDESDIEESEIVTTVVETTSTTIPAETTTVKTTTVKTTTTIPVETTIVKTITTIPVEITTVKTTTTVANKPTSTPSPKSCIKDSKVVCNSSNPVCSLGLDSFNARIYGSELLKIAKSSEIVNLVESLQKQYNKDVHYICTLSNFKQGKKDYRYISHDYELSYLETLKSTPTIVELYGDITCKPDNVNSKKLINSKVKLESSGPTEFETWLSTGSVRDLSPGTIEYIKVFSGLREFIEDKEYNITNGKIYILTSTINYCYDRDIPISGTDEEYTVDTTIGDNVIYEC